MNRIKYLINNLCPKGVDYKTLGDISEIVTKQTGFDYSKTIKPRLLLSKEEDSIPYIQTKFFSGTKFNLETDYYVPKDIAEKFPKIVLDSPCILFSIVGSIGNVGLFTEKEKCFLGGAICVAKILPEYNIKFIYYYVSSKEIQEQLRKKTKGSGQPTVTVEDIRNFRIPLPPIEIQEEIVRILDRFVELEERLEIDLQEELDNRKNQYDFWCNKLLFNDTYQKYKMRDICVISQGLQIPINQRKTEPGENRYFYITVQFLKNEGEKYYIENPSESVICKKDDILVTRTGSTGKIVFGVEGCFHNNFFKVTPTVDINKKYLFYVLSSKSMYKEMLRVASGGTVPDLPHRKFYDLDICLPPLHMQERIVNILDKYNKLYNDLIVYLPAEIELRRKQYEYYRNKLLSFEELSVSE